MARAEWDDEAQTYGPDGDAPEPCEDDLARWRAEADAELPAAPDLTGAEIDAMVRAAGYDEIPF